jgi:hypothetical protein
MRHHQSPAIPLDAIVQATPSSNRQHGAEARE